MLTSQLNNSHLYTSALQLCNKVLRYPAISNDLINFFQPADPAKAAFTKFGGVGKHYHFLRYLNHLAVEVRFGYAGSGKAKFKIDTINAEE